MSNKSSLANQILIGVLISIISAFVVKKLGFEKVKNEKSSIYIHVDKKPPASSRCIDCTITVTIENEATNYCKINDYIISPMYFGLILKEDQDKISYEITFTGIYDGLYYNKKYYGKASLSNERSGDYRYSKYDLKFSTSSRTSLGLYEKYFIDNIYLRQFY